jgi:hypothetical protein
MLLSRLSKLCLFAIAMVALPTVTDAGHIELFAVGSPDFSTGYYAGTIGFGVSDNGVVAATLNLGAANETAATYTVGGSIYALGVPARALAISADGTKVTGFSASTLSGAMAWTAGTPNVSSLDTLLGYTQGAAISRNGQYVAGVGGAPTSMATWNWDGTNGTALTNIGGGNFGWAGAVSNNGVVGGTSGGTTRVAAIGTVGAAGSVVQLGQGVLDNTIANPYGKVLGINSDGTMLVGESSVDVGGTVYSHSFLVNDTGISSTLVDIGNPLGFDNTAARSVTDRLFAGSGLIVGNAWNGDKSTPSAQAAVIWVPGSGPDLLANYALSAWGISGDGRFITGSARDDSGNQIGYLMVTGVPEPASFISLAIGAAATLYVRSRRRKGSVRTFDRI